MDFKAVFARGAALSLALALGVGNAQALEMKISGPVISLSGPIRAGDDEIFKELLKSPAGANVRVVRVDSNGGFVRPAAEIGRLIRKHGLSTLLDARSARCGSACTLLFAGGKNRHFVNGQAIKDGPVRIRDYRGLAFHEGSSALSLASNRHSGQATAQMVAFYHEFGVSAARNLITQAPPEGFYQISGPTALSLGIATSTSPP
ncbi:MAG: hypothetical protein LCH38_09630 [Proteobacteria bacterium]|nr:hypothetical protein [Pseudomonadota bacterium]